MYMSKRSRRRKSSLSKTKKINKSKLNTKKIPTISNTILKDKKEIQVKKQAKDKEKINKKHSKKLLDKNKQNKKFNFCCKKFFLSFVYAWHGILFAFSQRNIKVQSFIGILAIILGIKLKFSLLQWALLTTIIATVISGEMLNTAIEQLADFARDTLKLKYEETKILRDLAAGAVLVTSIASVISGIFLFLPFLKKLF